MRTLQESWKLLFLAMFGLSLTFAVGCSSTDEVEDDQVVSAEEEEWIVDPQVGMTKEEITEMYRGEPDSKQTASDGGEVWTYHMNAGAAWIPYNFGYRPEYDVITFGADGKVASFVLGR